MTTIKGYILIAVLLALKEVIRGQEFGADEEKSRLVIKLLAKNPLADDGRRKVSHSPSGTIPSLLLASGMDRPPILAIPFSST